MMKFFVGLSIVFIFASTANAKRESSNSDTSINDQIASLINATELEYRNVELGVDETFQTIIETIASHALNKSDEIMADLVKKLSEFEQLFVEIAYVNPSDCKMVTDQLQQDAYNAIDAMKICATDQLQLVNENVTDIKENVTKGLGILAGYKKNANKCSTDNANSESRTRRCLKRLMQGLRKVRFTDFSPKILEMKDWHRNSAYLFDSCTSKTTSLYYKHSELVVKMAKDCIQKKTAKKE